MKNNPLSSGLGKQGRAAAWVVAFLAVGGYNYYQSQMNSVENFPESEQTQWNKERKEEMKKSKNEKK